MLGILLLGLLPAAVPDVSSGPDLASAAVALEAPIREVTVFSDRARVVRKGAQSLARGPHALRLPDLPGATLLNTVHVTARGGRVLRVEIAPVERERLSIDQVDALIARLEAIGDTLARLDAEQAVFGAELELLRRLAPRPAVAEKDRVGKPLPALSAGDWLQNTDLVDRRVAAVQAELRALRVERERQAEAYQKTQADIGRHDLGGFSERRIQVLAIVEVTAGAPVELELVYSVPGAAWWPAYDLHFSPRDGTVTLYTAGQVQQASGEEWPGVELVLSTSIPGQDLQLPELLTWTLGERKDFVPQPRPERRPPAPPRFAAPPPRPHPLEIERQARQQAMQERLALLDELLSQDVGAVAVTGASVPGSPRPVATRAPRPARQAPPAPPPPMAAPPSEAYAEEVASYDREDDGVELAMEPAPSMAAGMAGGRAAAPEMARSSRRAAPQRPATSLALFDPTTWQRPSFGDPTLPAVVAGGLDYSYRATTPASVPSDGSRLRVPLASQTYQAALTYETTPALAATAYLTATVENGGRLPILRGPVNIFVGGAFTGEGVLQTTGPGGALTLPLGADEDIRVIHHVAAQTRTQGLLIKDEVTAYTTRIEIGNFKTRPITIDVFDVLPMTGNDKMEVQLEATSPALADKPDAKGRLRWRLDIPPKKTQVVTFTYSIKRPPNWQLRQR